QDGQRAEELVVCHRHGPEEVADELVEIGLALRVREERHREVVLEEPDAGGAGVGEAAEREHDDGRPECGPRETDDALRRRAQVARQHRMMISRDTIALRRSSAPVTCEPGRMTVSSSRIGASITTSLPITERCTLAPGWMRAEASMRL